MKVSCVCVKECLYVRVGKFVCGFHCDCVCVFLQQSVWPPGGSVTPGSSSELFFFLKAVEADLRTDRPLTSEVTSRSLADLYWFFFMSQCSHLQRTVCVFIHLELEQKHTHTQELHVDLCFIVVMCKGQRATAPPAAQRTAARDVEDEDTTLPSTTCSTTVTVRVVVVDELRTNQRTALSGF